MPYFCVDYFVSALDQAAPELGIDAESPKEIRARLVWPRIRPLIENVVVVEPAYTIEGDALLPAGVSSLMQRYPDDIHAVFVGYATTTPEEKLAQIRAYPGGVNDWVQKHSDAYILDLVAEMIEWSHTVERSCRRLNLPNFDVSGNFIEKVDAAYRSLL